MTEHDHTDKCGDHNCEMCYSEEIPEKLSMSLLQRMKNHWNAVLLRSPTNSMGPQGSSRETVLDHRHRIKTEGERKAQDIIDKLEQIEFRALRRPWYSRLWMWLRKPFYGPTGMPGAMGPMGAPGRDSGLEQMYDFSIYCDEVLLPRERAEIHLHAFRFVMQTGNWIECVNIKKTVENPNERYDTNSHLDIHIVAKQFPSSVTSKVQYKDTEARTHDFN